jgi:hypothetical protein
MFFSFIPGGSKDIINEKIYNLYCKKNGTYKHAGKVRKYVCSYLEPTLEIFLNI